MKIHEALVEVMRSIPVVRKEDRNQAQSFNFRGIDAVVNAVGPALRKHGVVVTPRVTEHHMETMTTARGAQMQVALLLVEYTFTGPEGDSISTVVPGQAADSGDKAVPKAMSVAFRTALLQTLALPTDERDPDADSHERVEPPPLVTPMSLALGELRTKIRELSLDGKEVAALYAQSGIEIGNESNPAKIREFTAKLEAPE